MRAAWSLAAAITASSYNVATHAQPKTAPANSPFQISIDRTVRSRDILYDHNPCESPYSRLHCGIFPEKLNQSLRPVRLRFASSPMTTPQNDVTFLTARARGSW